MAAASTAALTARKGTTVLFFDMAEIDELRNVVQTVCQAAKHPHNPVMAPGDKNAWDSAQASPWATRTVLYDEQEGLFKCWYNGSDVFPNTRSRGGYAVSRDGVRWEKPALGIYEFEGSRQNNIFGDNIYGCILKEPREGDPAKRYKMVATGWIYYSADGVRWSEPVRTRFNPPGPKAWDAVACVRYEDAPASRRYAFVWQYYDASRNLPGESCRHKGIAFSPDGFHWRPSRDNPVLSPNDGFEHENHFLMLIPYKGQYLMLYECGWYHPDGAGRLGRYTADIRLAHSRDGEHFTRINPHQAVIPAGEPGEWDGQFLVISDKAIVKDDVIHLYYCGQGRDWTSWPPANMVPGDRTVNPQTGKGATGNIGLSRMGLATLRPDGFTCVQAADGRSFGSLTTRPIRLGSDRPGRLTVNLGGAREGLNWLQAEILDPKTAKALPGFARQDCRPIAQDGLRVPVVWKDKTFRAVKARSIRVRFHLFGQARLYSFGFC